MGSPFPHPTITIPANSAQGGTLWGRCMAWVSGHLGPNPILEPQGIRQTSVYAGPASSSIYCDHGNAHLARGPNGRDRVTLERRELPVPGAMQAGADGCHGGCRGDTDGTWHCRYPHEGPVVVPLSYSLSPASVGLQGAVSAAYSPRTPWGLYQLPPPHPNQPLTRCSAMRAPVAPWSP